MITEWTGQTVFYAPTVKKRFLTLSGAIKAEAKAKIYKKYPSEPFEDDTGAGWDIQYDEPEKYAKLFSRLCRLLRREFRQIYR